MEGIDERKRYITDVTTKSMDNFSYRLANYSMEMSKEDIKNIKVEFGRFLEYTYQAIREYDDESKSQIMMKINKISDYFNAKISSKAVDARSKEADVIYGRTKGNTRNFENHIVNKEVAELRQEISKDLEIFKENTKSQKNVEINNIRSKAESSIADIIYGEMFEKIRSTFKYSNLTNKENFLEDIREYLRRNMTKKINEKLEEVSKSIDYQYESKLNDTVQEIKMITINKLNESLEEKKIEEKNPDKKSDLAALFKESLAVSTNSQEEILASEKNSIKEENKNKAERMALPDDLIS